LTKKAIINKNAKKYQKSAKKIKSKLLEELTKILHINRQYIASLLRNSRKVICRKGKIVVVADPTLALFKNIVSHCKTSY